MSFGRRFGIDFGETRIGIAVCDPDGLVSLPLTTLKNDETFLAEFKKLQDEYQVNGIFIGKPMNLSGSQGNLQSKISDFGASLSLNFGLPIFWVDERLTSNSASSALREVGLNNKASKGLIDQLAAVAILELGIALEKNA